jgi:hypothetical protein
MGLILVQPPKQSPHKSIVVFDHGVNLNNFNNKFQQQISTTYLGGGSFDPRFKDTSTIQGNKVFGYEG